jgi:xylulose-5-phosphate/fructose-6-phosphate phosphoketolase
VVLTGIGVEVTFEVVKAAELLRAICPALRVRVVNVTDLMILVPESKHPHALSREKFIEMFTADRPVLFNYHGYPTELQGLLFGRPGLERMRVGGYIEEGSTTTPFDMMLVNKVSRFDLAEKALREGAERNEEVKKGLEGWLKEVERQKQEVRTFITQHGKGESISVLSSLIPSLSKRCMGTWTRNIVCANFDDTDPDDLYELPKFD